MNLQQQENIQGDPCCDFHPDRSLGVHVAHSRQDSNAGIILTKTFLVKVEALSGFIRCLPLHGHQLT